MAWTFEKILKGARKHGASDIHLVRGVAPVFRLTGEIRPIEGEPLDAPTLRRLFDEIVTDRHREVFDREWQLCFSRHWEGVGRFRVSVYNHAGGPEMSIRLCETVVRSADDLGLPPIVEELTRLPHGLVLVTGPTGVGKTTTLNFMVDSTCTNGARSLTTWRFPTPAKPSTSAA
ncbi:MAG TPA: ATPase, T2SS/T4P/T4SS family, partial [Pirellulales bacterium]|nr:ATPase, T2SS/T4P/T4SS family [Pirellulales bacterium]